MSNNDFENFFGDEEDDLFGGSDLDNLEDLQPSFPEDDVDEFGEVEEEGGISTTFKVAAALLGAVFLGLMGVIAFLILGGDDSISSSALTATAITLKNQEVETSVAASETAISVTETAVALLETSVAQTKTAEAIITATAEEGVRRTQVSFEETKAALDATATQIVLGATQTASVATPTPGTITIVIRDPLANNAPAANVPVCVFIDDGDGVFNPAPGSLSACLPVAGAVSPTSPAAAASPSPTLATSGGELNPIFQTSTAQAGGAGGVTSTSPTPGLNPIFQTSTAQAGGQIAPPAGGVTQTPAQIPATATSQAPAQPPTPTLEAGGAGFGESFSAAPYLLPVGRSISGPDSSGEVAQQEGGDEQYNPGQVFYTNDQGQLVITGLPPGRYWIKIADQIVNFEVTTEAQLLPVDVGTGEPIELLIEGAAQVPGPGDTGGGSPTSIIPSPTTEIVNPIVATQTAAALQTAAAQGTVPPPSPQGTLTGTGLFSGDSNEVTSTDLLILALAGMVLVGVVMAARRLRSTS